NFMVYPGNNYQLAASAACGFLRGQSDIWGSFDYPYGFENVLSIKDADTGEGWYSSKKLYPYFYNWHVSTPDCYSERTPVYAALNNDPAAGFQADISNMGVEFDNVSEYATSYHWDFGDGSASEEVSPQHTYVDEGEYMVTLTAFNDCGSDVFSQDIEVIETGVYNTRKNDIKVFPNPADNFVILKTDNECLGGELKIYNLTGRIIFTDEISKNITRVDVSGFKSGMYILHVINDDQNIKTKILIQH
ncbi:MAG: T9SS type A sorting domain-containing protein, partial [Bacteroidota bacterium]